MSADNFFDLDPVLGRNGVPEKFHGDGSDVITDEALKFIRKQAAAGKPFLAVVWFGTPHVPHIALPKDKEAYKSLPEKDQNYFGELTGVDRSVGRIRRRCGSWAWRTTPSSGTAATTAGPRARSAPASSAVGRGRCGRGASGSPGSSNGPRACPGR